MGWRLSLALFLTPLCFCLLFASFHPKWNSAWNCLWTCSRGTAWCGSIHIIQKWNNYLALCNMSAEYRRAYIDVAERFRSKWVISIKSLILYVITRFISGAWNDFGRRFFMLLSLSLLRCAHQLFYRIKLFVPMLICYTIGVVATAERASYVFISNKALTRQQ